MRYREKDMQRTFRVPFGAWLIPISGSLLCILLLIGTSAATGCRFLVWTALGQIIYFSYGFWHSKQRDSTKCNPTISTVCLVTTIESTMEGFQQNESELEVNCESSEN